MPPNMETLAVAGNPEDETVFAAAGNVTNGGACPSGQTCPLGGTGLLKSSDCGSTWTLVTSKMPGFGQRESLHGRPVGSPHRSRRAAEYVHEQRLRK